MKILRIIARLNVGGPARHVVWETCRLKGEGFESVLIAGTVPDGEEDMGYFATENGVVPIYIPELSRELSMKDAVSLFKIYREIKSQKPDIVHTHTAKAGTVGRVAAFFYRWVTFGAFIGRPRPIRVIHTFHGHVFHSYYGPTKTRIFIAIEKLLARLATDKIVVISHQQFEEIHGKYGVGKKDQFVVIPLGIVLSEFKHGKKNRCVLRSEISASADEIVVGFTGRLTEIKNLWLLLDVIEKYQRSRSSVSPKLKFVIIGDGSLRDSLEERSKELGIEGLITFLGSRKDVSILLPGMDIIVLTSRNEGTPLSLIEAMAAGIPLVSTAVGGVVDLVGERIKSHLGFDECERGVIVDSEDPEYFFDGLIYLAKNEKLRERLRIAGKLFIEANYSVERLTEDLTLLYSETQDNKIPH